LGHLGNPPKKHDVEHNYKTAIFATELEDDHHLSADEAERPNCHEEFDATTLNREEEEFSTDFTTSVSELNEDHIANRPQILLPTDNWLVSNFADKIGSALSGADIFNRQGIPFTIHPIRKEMCSVTPDVFRTHVENWLVCYRLRKDKDGKPQRVFRTMSKFDAEAVLVSEAFLKHLPPIRRLNHIRLPILRQNGRVEPLPLGYDKESQIFTFENAIVSDQEKMTLTEAVEILKDLLNEFCFPNDDGGRSFAVAISAMLTLFALGLLPREAILPCFIARANAEGAGKTALIKTIISIVFGSFIAGVKPASEDEVRKFLTAAVLEGRPYVLYDNLKSHLDSPALEAFLTTSVWSDRILGQSRSITAEKSTVVFITGNDCTVSPDMRRRSLVLELFLHEERAEERKFNRELDSFIKENRSKILNALWTLVRVWDENERPPGSMHNASFPEWSRIIGSIVESAGFGSPLRPPKNAEEIDRDGADMRKLVESLPKETQCREFSFSELMEIAQQVGAFENMFSVNGIYPDGLDKSAKTHIARILKRYDRRTVGGYTLRLIGQGHSRRYEFKALGVGRVMPAELE
jgi:hypothetical protein